MPDIDLVLRFPGTLKPLDILDRFERLAAELKIKASTWAASNSGDSERPGGLRELRKYISKHEAQITIFSLSKPGRSFGSASIRRGVWQVTFLNDKADAKGVEQAVRTLRLFASDPDLIDGYVYRGAYGTRSFPLVPPIAGDSYAVLVTDEQVAEAYDDPTVFWKAWDHVETLGQRKLCTRALDALRWERWLGETFERTMALARAAKPKRTQFPIVQLVGGEEPWWEFGDVQDEKAGWPMLDLVGYEPKTETLEYAAKPRHRGHVLIQELQNLKAIVEDGKTPDGKPVKTVRAVFLDEAQARAEKRPLLDVGVEVYYLDKTDELIQLTS